MNTEEIEQLLIAVSIIVTYLIVNRIWIILIFSLLILHTAAFLHAITRPFLLSLGGCPLFALFLLQACRSCLSSRFGDRVRVSWRWWWLRCVLPGDAPYWRCWWRRFAGEIWRSRSPDLASSDKQWGSPVRGKAGLAPGSGRVGRSSLEQGSRRCLDRGYLRRVVVSQNCRWCPRKAHSRRSGCLVHPRCVLVRFWLGGSCSSIGYQWSIRAKSTGHRASRWGLVNIIACKRRAFGHQITVIRGPRG